jgi:hypothetical protein
MKTVKPNHKKAKKKAEQPAKKQEAPPNMKEALLNGPRFDLIIPRRRKWRSRPPVIFD